MIVEQELDNGAILARIQEVIAGKYWYSYSPDGSFDWDLSVEAVAEELGLEGSSDQVKWAMETAFTPQSLTRVQLTGEYGEEEKVPLVELLGKLREERNLDLFVWTVGDVDWQRQKAERCGIFEVVDPYDNFLCSGSDKVGYLTALLEERGEMVAGSIVFVVDDKPEQLERVKQLGGKDYSISDVDDYHLKLDDTQADPTAFYYYLLERLEEIPSDQQVIVVADMDGVLINTDGTIFGPASENIAALITRQSSSNL